MTNPTDTLSVDTSNGKLRGRRVGGVPAWLNIPYVLPGPLNTLISSSSQFSEDCLYLNVWSPAADGRKRPVWVWLHGGAYELGGGSQYLGHELAKQGDIVFVSIN